MIGNAEFPDWFDDKDGALVGALRHMMQLGENGEFELISDSASQCKTKTKDKLSAMIWTVSNLRDFLLWSEVDYNEAIVFDALKKAQKSIDELLELDAAKATVPVSYAVSP
eukprot:m.354583 g.354583  ORF g.354583 m.354583 type:complete len:111 (-) comp74440_c0_seq1:91-423(-)